MRVTFVCQFCKTKVTRNKTGSDKMLYCNTSCSNKARKKHQISPSICSCGGKKNWVAQTCNSCAKLGRRTSTLAEIRAKCNTNDYHTTIRNYAREDFQGSKVCYICSYSLAVDICHVRAVKDFPVTATLAEVNAVDNLVALCKNHHWELDHGYLTLEKHE